MPSESKAQRRAMAIAEHDPSKLYPENKGLAKMSKSSLHDFAKTPEKHLPEHKKPEEKRGMHMDEKHHGCRMKHTRGG